VLESIPRAKLVIAGRGPEQEHLTKLAKTLGISDAVKLLGFRDDIPNVVNVFDIVAQPSIEEAFGLSMVEAMALGKPIVGSNVGGIPEVVDDGVTGILVPPGDCNALSKAIVDLLNDPARRNQFGDAGKLRAETLFTIERLACDYEGAWTEVLSKNHESYNVR
jgi:glycosyltransferase involved in cell wall biosynthesis